MKRLLAPVTVSIVVCLAAAACSAGTEDTPTTNEVASTVQSQGDAGAAEPDESKSLRIGLTARITTDNWFAALDTENLEQNRAFLTSSKTSLFALSLPGFVQVPMLAATETPVQPIREGEVWVVDQPIRRDWTWSDGVPVTAQDLVFYFDTVREFGLGFEHATAFGPTVLSITAPDDYTVRVEFSASPSFTDWSQGVGVAPFVPRHFWQKHAEGARAAGDEAMAAVSDADAVQALVAESLADDDSGNDLVATDITADQIGQYIRGVGSSRATATLYSTPGQGEPSIGPVIFDRWERGSFAVTVANPNYFHLGTESTLYSDGSFRMASGGRGEDTVYGGAGRGAILAHYTEDLSVSEIMWVEHDSREAAYESLGSGRVDFVYDTIGVTPDLRDALSENPDLRFSEGTTDRLRYMGFNLRKPPMSDLVFRTAVATVIDKEFVAKELLADEVIPAYTVVAPGLLAHYNADVPRAGWSGESPMPAADRFDSAIAMLKEAGYTWRTEPVVVRDEEGEFLRVDPKGERLTMPNGTPVPDLSLLTPAEEYDPYRATFASYIETQARELGIPITAEPTDFDSIVAATFPPQNPETVLQWDMYILAWGRGDPAPPGILLRALFHSDQDSVESGGFNTTGYRSTEFDVVADSFVDAIDLDTAAQLTRDMDGILARDLPYIVLFRIPIIEAFNNRVQFPVPTILSGHSGFPKAWPSSVQVTE